MLLYVLRENLDIVGVIDSWQSLIWNTKLQTAGSFELYVTATPRNKRFLQANRFLARSDSNRFMYITSIDDKTEEDGKTITVSGYSVEGILRKRMYPIWSNNYIHGGSYTLRETFNAINPFGFKIDTTSVEHVYTGEVATGDLRTNMETYLRFLLTREGDMEGEDSDFWILPQTYIIEFDYAYPNEGFILYPEVLKDYRNNPPICMFSEDIGNIHDVSYSYSEEGCSSAIIALINTSANIIVQQATDEVDEQGNPVYSQINLSWSDLENTTDMFVYKTVATSRLGSNEEVIYVDPVVKITNSYDRSESKHVTFKPLPQDVIQSGTKYASEGQKEEFWSTETTAYTYYVFDAEATYKAMNDAIDEKLLMATENVQGTVNTDKITAKNIGDIVVIRDNDRLVDLYKRIEEIEETFDNSGYQITPTFGEPLKTIFDVDRRMINSLLK